MGDILACDPATCSDTLKKIAHEPELALKLVLNGHTITADDRAVYWAAVDAPDGGADAGSNSTGVASRIMKLAK